MGIIRLLLAISVVIYHSSTPVMGLTLVGGFLAVPLFFIISGFYMAMVLNEKYASYHTFIISRFLKIFPSYWTVLILCFSFKNVDFFAYGIWSGLYFIFSNLFILGSQFTAILYANGNHLEWLPLGSGYRPEIVWDMLYIGPIWSLSIELLFYICAPFCVKGKYIWLKLSLLPLLSLMGYIFLDRRSSWMVPWNYNFFVPCAYLFSLGAASYLFFHKHALRISQEKIVNFGVALTLIVYIFSYQFLPKNIDFYFLPFPVNLDVIGIILFTAGLPFAFQATKRSKLDRLLGNMSYPLYIAHMFFIHNFPYMKSLSPLGLSFGLALLIELTIVPVVERYRIRFMH